MGAAAEVSAVIAPRTHVYSFPQVFIISMSYGDYAFITIGFGLMVLVYSYGVSSPSKAEAMTPSV